MIKKISHTADTDSAIPETRFSTSRRGNVIASARDAWSFFNLSRVDKDDTRFIGTTLAIISTIVGLASSITYLVGGVASRTKESTPVRLTLRIHNFTPYVIVIRRADYVSSRVWSSPVILSGQTIEIPYALGNNLNNRPNVQISLVDEQRSVMNIDFLIADNGRFVRVIRTQFASQSRINDPFPDDTDRENGMVFYRGNPVNGVTPTLTSSTITNGIDGEIDVSILTSTTIRPTS